jgi:hypothetical protein
LVFCRDVKAKKKKKQEEESEEEESEEETEKEKKKRKKKEKKDRESKKEEEEEEVEEEESDEEPVREKKSKKKKSKDKELPEKDKKEKKKKSKDKAPEADSTGQILLSACTQIAYSLSLLSKGGDIWDAAASGDVWGAMAGGDMWGESAAPSVGAAAGPRPPSPPGGWENPFDQVPADILCNPPHSFPSYILRFLAACRFFTCISSRVPFFLDCGVQCQRGLAGSSGWGHGTGLGLDVAISGPANARAAPTAARADVSF